MEKLNQLNTCFSSFNEVLFDLGGRDGAGICTCDEQTGDAKAAGPGSNLWIRFQPLTTVLFVVVHTLVWFSH